MCGITGIVGTGDIAKQIYYNLVDLQHRGQQGCGMAVSKDGFIKVIKNKGMVYQVFPDDDDEIFKELPGNCGIGHTLYSTIGKSGEIKQTRTFQPLIGYFYDKPFALAHNGNLIELEGLREEAKRKGYQFKSEVSDTEVIVALLSTSRETDFIEALKKVLPRLKGAFALTILFDDKVIGVRDKCGIRPLCLGQGNGTFILSSESCALYTLEANFIREIEPGEIIILGKDGIERQFIWADSPCLCGCIIELIYFARPDSKIFGQYVQGYRERAGTILAKEHPVEADVVMPIPESGRIYCDPFAAVLGISVREGIFRNRHIPKRTFISPRDTDRRKVMRIKLHPVRPVIHGKSVCVTDDSIIRANVSSEVSRMLRNEGATEVHVRIGSAPIRHPCCFGIDMPTRGELIAANFSVEEIQRRIIQVDSLGYLSLRGMIEATGLPRENLCLGCFTGEYPE